MAFIDAGDTNTFILNKNGELYACGSGSQTGLLSGSSKVLTKIVTKDKVVNFSCGSNFSIFATETNELYALGSNTEGRCGINWG